MHTYVDLKKEEQELQEQLKKINQENIEILSQLSEFKIKYPKAFNVISVDLSTVDLDRIIYRLIVLQDDVNISKDIPEEEKKHIINLINGIGQKSREKVEQCGELKDKLEKNKIEIENRKKYVLEKVELIKENKNKQQSLEEKKNFYEKLMLHKYCEPSIKFESEKIINNINLEKNLIQNEINSILEESNIKEDYNLINSGTPIEIEELKQEQPEEEPEDEMTIQAIEPQIVLSENNETQVTELPEIVEPQLNENTTGPDLDAVKPENPLKVILKKQATPELISKIKTGGKTALGILAIGAAVAAVIANPLALAAIPAGGLLYEQAKEHILKK